MLYFMYNRDALRPSISFPYFLPVNLRNGMFMN